MKAIVYLILFSIVLIEPLQAQHNRKFLLTLRKLSREGNIEEARGLINNLVAEGERRNLMDRVILAKLFLGELMQRTANFAEAEAAYLDAYQLYQKHFDARKRDNLFNRSFPYTYCDAIDQLAHFYVYTGNLKKAEQLFQTSIDVRTATFKPLSVHRIHPVIGLGSVYLRQGKVDKTFEQFNKAQEMIRRATTTGFDFDQLNRLYYHDMIEICFQQGKLSEARRYIKLLAIGSSGIMKFPSKLIMRLETARVFELYARLHLFEGDSRKAQEYLNKANEFYPKQIPTSGIQFKILKTQAMLYWAGQDWANADMAFLNLVKQYREHVRRNFIAMSEYEKEQFYYTLKNDFDLFNSYVAASFDRNPTVLLGELYNNVINTKALLLNATNQKKNRILASGNTELINKLHDWEKTKTTLSALYFEGGTEDRIAATTKILEELEKSINQSSGLFEEAENPATWEKIQTSLHDGEAAVEMVRALIPPKPGQQSDSSVYIMLTLKPGQLNPAGFLIPAGRQFEGRNLTYYRNSIMTRTEDPLSYNNFWSPIKNNLDGVKRVYFSPDGVYNQLNLNTLRNASTSQYIIDEIELLYLTNTADLLTKSVGNTTKDAVLVGRPHFDEAGNYSGGRPSYGQRNLLSEELISFKEQEFQDLPGTEEELNIIGSTLQQQGVQVTSYLGPEAVEQNVKAVKGPSVFHIATHGFFVEDSASVVSPMIRSGLVLAGVKSKTKSTEDGILTAYEATNLDLQNTSLVVLSACQTGLGEVRNGDGVYGLQRAIIVAGARNLLMSLWKVDDAATADLMSAFYMARQQLSNSSAFRDAQIKLREKYPQPYFWGAFIMLGK
jgi:CHAT domain-containing protein